MIGALRVNIHSSSVRLCLSTQILERIFWYIMHLYITFEPAHDKTYNKTYVTSKDSDQPVHPSSMTRFLVYPSLDSPEVVEGTYDQQRLWSDCADAQADLSLRWSRKSYCRFCHALAYLSRHPYNQHPSVKEICLHETNESRCSVALLHYTGIVASLQYLSKSNEPIFINK